MANKTNKTNYVLEEQFLAGFCMEMTATVNLHSKKMLCATL